MAGEGGGSGGSVDVGVDRGGGLGSDPQELVVLGLASLDEFGRHLVDDDCCVLLQVVDHADPEPEDPALA